jgi:hypothetical protein
MAPKIAQLGHDESERLTQDLMMGFAVENAEVAMYESLAVPQRLSSKRRRPLKRFGRRLHRLHGSPSNRSDWQKLLEVEG